jgi:hypothetical protein
VQAFFDVVKNRYDVLLRIGSLFLLFALPLLAVYFIFNIYGNSLLDNLQSGSLSQEEYASALLQWSLLKRVLEGVCLLLFAFPLSASLRLIRRLAYQENIQFGGDVSLGIKKNLKECALLALLLSLAFFVSSFAFDYGSLYYSSDYGMSLAMDVPLALSVFFFFPIALFVFAQIPVYANSLSQSFRNALGFYGKSVFPSLGIVLLFLLPIGIFFIPNLYAVLGLSLFAFMVYLPLLMLFFFLYASSLFDRYLNKASFPSLVDKGILRKKGS